MALNVDQEILQDFMVEATEILELLSEQLIELESDPKNTDLLNAIFRGFHTVKGGAGFLSFDNLVSVCHVAENVFDILRTGQRHVDADLMDVILRALDTVNTMFDEIRGEEEPSPAEPELLEKLNFYASASTTEEALDEGCTNAESTVEEIEAANNTEAKAEPSEKEGEVAASDEITDDEFESLLDSLHGVNDASEQDTSDVSKEDVLDGVKATAAESSNDEITDDEFEAMLDALHGKGEPPKSEVKSCQESKGKPETIPESEPIKKPESKPESVAKAKPKKAPASTIKSDVKVKEPAAETTVRVDTKRLDDIMNMVGELVLVRNRLVNLGLAVNNENLVETIGSLDIVTADLQTAVMKTRMQPVKKVFGRFPRVVRDLARNLKKDIVLEMSGEDTDLDKNLVEALADPLVHLVRNSVDHGIETPDIRISNGKPGTGTVKLSAEQEGDHIILSIIDDGSGMDANMLRRKAVEKGIMDTEAAKRLTDEECYNIILMPGFSTKEEVSDISGRGVGMDVVKTKISQLNGSIKIQSKLGEGTKLSIKVPLTLAILPTLMIVLGEQIFALPLTSVSEILNVDLSNTNVVDGQETIVVRNQALPLFYLRNWLVHSENEPDLKDSHVVIVVVGTQQVAFVVDQLIGQEEVVIKPLGESLHGTPGMAGATITGDGRIAMILDLPMLLRHYGQRAVGF